MGDDRAPAEADAGEQVAVGDAGRGEQDVAARHLAHVVFAVEVGDAHAARALALLVGIDDQAALHLAADAAERRRGEHALGRAADAE